MEEKRKLSLGIRIPLITVGVIVLVGIIFGLWVLFPVQQIPVERLLPNDAVISAGCTFDSKKPGIELLKARIKEFLVTKQPGIKNIPFFGSLYSYVFPKQVSLAVSFDPTDKAPQAEAIIGMSNSIRFLSFGSTILDRSLFKKNRIVTASESGHTYKTFGNPPGKTGITAYSILENSLIAGTDPSIVKKTLKSFNEGNKAFPHMQKIAANITDTLSKHDLYVYMDNSGKGLTRLIHAFEEKVSFSTFPSIDSVDSISGFADVTAERLTGKLFFICTDKKNLGDVEKDVKFFYGAIRRVLRPQNLDITGDETSEDDTVIFTYSIDNFIENLFNNF